MVARESLREIADPTEQSLRQPAKSKPEGDVMLYAVVWRGKNIGIRLMPHKYKDGKYHVAREKGKYIHVDFDEIIPRIRDGYGVRMGNNLQKHHPDLSCLNQSKAGNKALGLLKV